MRADEPALALLAHGTRDPAGAAEIDRLAQRLRAQVATVVVGYADVRPPTLADALANIGGPAVVVPAFLAAGYHVRVDVPAQLAATGRTDVLLAEPLGPDPALIEVAADRLDAAGYASGDQVVLAAAGSRDSRATDEVSAVATALGDLLDTRVEVGFATGSPRVADVVADLKSQGRVAVASWLLAPGLFQRTVEEAGADVVAQPLGAHEGVAAVVLARYAAKCPESGANTAPHIG